MKKYQIPARVSKTTSPKLNFFNIDLFLGQISVLQLPDTQVPDHVISKIYSLGKTIVDSRPVMDPAIEPAFCSFFCGLPEGGETPYREAVFGFGIILIREIVSEDLGEYCRCSSGNHRVTAWVFRERGSLQYRFPILIDMLVDQGFRPNKFTPEFFVPTADKPVGNGNGGGSIGIDRFFEIQVMCLGGYL